MSSRRKVVVTGASSGIGRATAVRFAADGWDVCVLARREPLLRELLAELSAGDHLLVAGDASEQAVADALGACSCATEWNEARAEGWWLAKASAPSAASPLPTQA